MNKNHSTSLTAWLVCVSAALFFFYEFIQMNMLNSIGAMLMADFHIDAAQLGNLSASYLYADALLLFPAGLIVDRTSVRLVTIIGMIVAIFFTILFALSPNAIYATLWHFIIGLGNAFCFLCCILLAARWFPPHRMALIVGLIITIAMLGGAVAQSPLAILAQHIGWRNTMWVNAGLGILILLAVISFVKDYPPEHANQHANQKSQLKAMGFWQSIQISLKNTQNWYSGIYTCLMNLPIILLGGLWGNMYLAQVDQLSSTKASTVPMMIFFGTMIGSPLAGFISDHLKQRKLPMIVGSILALLIILAIIYIKPLNYVELLILFLGLGIVTSTQVLSYPLIAESNSPLITGTATAFASIIIMGGGAAFQPFYGWLMDLHWNHAYLNGQPIYSNHDFLLAMAIIPCAFILSFIISLLIRETSCIPFSKSNTHD